MTRSEYNAVRRRVYEARRACAIETSDDGRSSYGSKSIRENSLDRELNAALACDPRHKADRSITPQGYFDSSRYEWRVKVRRTEILRALTQRRDSEARCASIVRLYLKPLKEV